MVPPLDIQKQKNLSASEGFAPLTADQGLCPWTKGVFCVQPDDNVGNMTSTNCRMDKWTRCSLFRTY